MKKLFNCNINDYSQKAFPKDENYYTYYALVQTMQHLLRFHLGNSSNCFLDGLHRLLPL